MAVAKTIAAFTELGYDISLPITECAAYDLIVDIGSELKRVQIKYCGVASGEVGLRHIHSNSGGYVIQRPCIDAYDWLVVLWQNQLWISKESMAGRTTIRVTDKNFDVLGSDDNGVKRS